jgi:hypothetical protein
LSLGKSRGMRPFVLIIIAVIVIGALFVLSTLPKERAMRTIEVDVPAPGGNAH